MKAIGIYRHLPVTDKDCFVVSDVEVPVPEGRELLVKVEAVSVNPVDVKNRARKKDDGKFSVLGWDVSGKVVSTGPDCEFFSEGDEVYFSGNVSSEGNNSEYSKVDERIVGKKPQSLSHAEAAALPLTSLTAWEALFDRMSIPLSIEANEGKTILIIGAAGGVGSIAAQLASMAGLIVAGTASREESAKWAKEHGVSIIIDRKKDFREQMKESGIGYSDYILCTNSLQEHFSNMSDVIAPFGRMCSIIGFSGPVEMNGLWPKSVSFSWEFMSTRPNYGTPDMVMQHQILNDLSDLVDSGRIRSTLSRNMGRINAENLRKAHAQLETGGTIGKVVLESFQGD